LISRNASTLAAERLSIKRARELNREFAALLREGATDGRLSPAPADG